MMIRRMSLLASNPTCTIVSIIVTIRKCWDYLLVSMLESRGHRGTTGSKIRRRMSILKIKTVSLLYDHTHSLYIYSINHYIYILYYIILYYIDYIILIILY